MNKNTVVILIVMIGLLLTGCNVINPKEEVPTYVHIDSFKFVNPNPNLTGTGNQSITSVWAYIDGEPVGVYDLPANIPVIINGTKQLQLAPGVINQGLKDYQLLYPFFLFYKVDLTAAPGTVTNLIPETKYVDSLKYWIEDFESSGNSFIKLSGDTSIRRVTGADSVFEGGGAACISLGSYAANAESVTQIDVIPSTEGYLEFNYKGTLPFQVGIIAFKSVGGSESYYLGGIKSKETWGKFYIDIRRQTAQYTDATFGIIIKTELPEGVSEGYILLDNLKVISY